MNDSRKAIFFDIDGTLLNHGKGPFLDDLEAMEEAARQGHYLFVNTGRSFSNISDSIMDLSFWNGISAGGGAHVLLKGNSAGNSNYNTIYHKWIDDDCLDEVCAWYLKNKKQLLLEGEKCCYVTCPSARYLNTGFFKMVTGRDDFRVFYSDDYISKITMENVKSSEERRLLEKFFTVNVFPTYAEALIKGENKGKAIGIILEAIGLKQEDSIALGDSINDLDMIRYAGLGVAMGNACAELKDAADAITGNCGEGGVSEAIKRYVLPV